LPREAAAGQQVMAAGINSSGTVVGNYYTSDGLQQSFVWVPSDDPTTEDGLDLGTLGGPIVRAQQVSDTGTVIGNAENAQGATAGFVWRPSAIIQDLGTLGGTSNRPAAISSNGMWIVGTSAISSGQRRAYRIGPIQTDIPKLVRGVSPQTVTKGLIGLAGMPVEASWCATLGRESTYCPGDR
jgi:probable HAF family extracellular repeat protein